MPKAPITSRETYFNLVRGSGQGAGDADRNMLTRQLDWNVVTTELGTMVEPRRILFETSKMLQEDVTDNAYTAIRHTDENTFQSDFGTGGQQLPVDYNA